MEILLVFWLACGVFAAVVANSRRRNGCLWGVLGVLFGPIALLAVGFMPVGEAPPPAPPPSTPAVPPGYAGATVKRCQGCNRANPPYAQYCEFCGAHLPTN